MTESTPAVRILHLEDDPHDADLLADTLEAAGMVCDIVRANSRQQYESALADGVYDVVLCDYNLPGYDGLSAVILARQKQPGAAVIVVSGNLGAEEAVQCLQAGAMDYIHKQRLERFAPVVKRAMQQREEQQLTQTILDTVVDGILTIDERGKVISFNRAAERMFGYAAAEVIGHNVMRLMAEPDSTQHDNFLQAYLATGEAHITGIGREVVGLRKNGGTFPMDVAIAEMRVGNKRHYAGIVRDVSERKQAEQNQRRLHEWTRLQAALAMASNDAVKPEEAFQSALKLICDYGGWRLGHMVMFAPDQTANFKAIASLWQVEDSDRTRLAALIELCERHDYASGTRLVGKVIAGKAPVWIEDLRVDGPSRRGAVALSAGLHCAFAFPVIVKGEVAAVLEFYAEATCPANPLLLDDITPIAAQLARVIERARANEVQSRLAAIVENSSDAIVGRSFDANVIVAWNAGAQRLFGYTAAEAMAHGGMLLTPPELRHETLYHREQLRLGIAMPPYETVRLTKDGRRLNVLQTLSAIRDSAGNIVGTSSISHDITARKVDENRLRENEQRMRATFENAPIAIAHIGLDSSYLRVNNKLCELLGYSREELLTMKTQDTNHPDERETQGRALRLLQSGETSEYTTEKRFVRKDGVAVWAKRTISMVHDADGEPLYMIRMVEDISARKAAELALHDLNEQLEDKVTARTAEAERARHEAEAANRAKSSFLATMSHEIRTPMNGVIGMIDVLQQSSLRGEQIEMVELIRESAYTLLEIINDILDFSKIEAGRLDLEQTSLSLADVVESVCSLINSVAEKKGVILTVFMDPAIPAWVMGDALRLRQVLTNLLSNAVKFCSGQLHAGRVSVRATLAARDPQQVTVEFRVTDNGIGMDEATQARLFSAFTQADASTTRRFGGTGLGLAIAHKLVKLKGGDITVHSVPGAGATFLVRLPFDLPPPASATAEAETSSAVAGLHCVVVGEPGWLADDLAAYLVHAHAVVERAPNLASAKQGVNRVGVSVWVVDAGDEVQSLEQMRAATRAEINQAICPVLVLIERGTRRLPRATAPDLITVDGNALGRQAFLNAVAAAAGRTSLEKQAVALTTGKFVVSAPPRAEAVRRGRLILVAEDNVTNQKVIVRQLALLGHTADVAANGIDALTCWQSGDYALLLTDLHMPAMDGYELTKSVRSAEKGKQRMPIIALTANTLEGEAARCLAVGMDDYHSKPLPLAVLETLLEKWLPAAPASLPTLSTLSERVTGSLPAAALVPVDVNVLKALVGNDATIVREFLQDFRSSAAAIALELRAACAARQTQAVVDAVHKLKSAARAVGALALGELCDAMEAQGKAGDGDAMVLLLPRFEAEMAVVKKYLDKWLIHAASDVI
jgi:PAS domain S-box-containing protein